MAKLKYLIIFGGFFTILCVEAKIKNLKYKVKASSSAELRDSRFVKARIWSLQPQIKIKYQLIESLQFKANLEALFETGSNDSLYIDEYRPRRELILSEGKLNYHLFSFLHFDLGAINQMQFNSPLFLGNNAFAGVQEILILPFMNWKLVVKLQQAIPSNQTLSSRLSSVDEGTPRFYSESVKLAYKSEMSKFEVEHTLYSFENLSRSVANESRYLGNQVSGTGQENAQFVYPFKGHNTFAKFNIKTGWVAFLLSGHYTHNNEAPNGRADAYLVKTGIGFGEFSFKYETFLSEADAVPAYYNTKFYGHSNVEGQVFGVNWKSLENSVILDLKFIKGTLLETSLYQDDFSGTHFQIKKSF